MFVSGQQVKDSDANPAGKYSAQDLLWCYTPQSFPPRKDVAGLCLGL